MSLLQMKPGESVPLEEHPDGTRRAHLFDEDTILAVNTAWASQRPLLVRGAPGTGKSQLAEAVAKYTQRKFIPFVVDSKTEARDLLWRFDAVKRLADAQLQGALGNGERVGEDSEEARNRYRDRVHRQLAEQRYIEPGPLWWAFDWGEALKQNTLSQAKSPYPNSPGDPAKGCVVLIDEMDKAEADVPNGLLGALGGAGFQPFGIDEPIRIGKDRPLVIITTNEERPLPDAFVRRCIVHFMEVPDGSEPELTHHLVERGRLHFPQGDAQILNEAAKLLWQDRIAAKRQQQRPYPGQAEYLDLLRAICHQEKTPEQQSTLLKRIAKFVLKKNRGIAS